MQISTRALYGYCLYDAFMSLILKMNRAIADEM